jgi:hypothetical protein
MYSTLIYLYQQKRVVLLPEEDAAIHNIRWNPVYAQTLKLNKGIDNVILFQCLNQDQKPVNISDSGFVFRLIDHAGKQLLLTTDLEAVDLTKGKLKLVLRSFEIANIPPQLCSYSVTRVRDESELLPDSSFLDSSLLGRDFVEGVLVDDHSGARGVIEILDSVFPSFIPSLAVTVPDPWVPSGEVHSSTVSKNTDGVITFQISPGSFLGEVSPEGSIGPNGAWYDAGDTVVVSDDTPLMLTVVGHYDQVRLKFVPTAGTVERISAR